MFKFKFNKIEIKPVVGDIFVYCDRQYRVIKVTKKFVMLSWLSRDGKSLEYHKTHYEGITVDSFVDAVKNGYYKMLKTVDADPRLLDYSYELTI